MFSPSYLTFMNVSSFLQFARRRTATKKLGKAAGDSINCGNIFVHVHDSHIVSLNLMISKLWRLVDRVNSSMDDAPTCHWVSARHLLSENIHRALSIQSHRKLRLHKSRHLDTLVRVAKKIFLLNLFLSLLTMIHVIPFPKYNLIIVDYIFYANRAIKSEYQNYPNFIVNNSSSSIRRSETYSLLVMRYHWVVRRNATKRNKE